MSSSFFVNDDAYTETAFIASRKGVHPNVRLVYRPLTVQDRTVASEAIALVAEKQSAKAADAEMANRVAAQIKEWEVFDDQGKDLLGGAKPTGENLLRIKSVVYERIAAIVFRGIDGGDDDPYTKTPAKTLAPADQLEADQKN
jgi:hypothetical protein